MGSYNSFREMKAKRKELSEQRRFIGEEIQNSLTNFGRTSDTPWYKNVDNWFLAGNILFEIYKRNKK